jgi:hypothetical protein
MRPIQLVLHVDYGTFSVSHTFNLNQAEVT